MKNSIITVVEHKLSDYEYKCEELIKIGYEPMHSVTIVNADVAVFVQQWKYNKNFLKEKHHG